MKNLFILISTLSSIATSFANGERIPTYNEIFSNQQKCNPKYFNNSSWDKKLPLLARMKTNTYVVISKPVITELPIKNTQEKIKKDYKISAVLYSKFRCDADSKLRPSLEKDGVVDTLVSILETGKGTGKFFIVGGSLDDLPGLNPDKFSNFLYEASTGDERDGVFCIVLIDDFLKDSSTINVDNLCPGKLAKNREATKKGIEKTRNSWIAAGVGKLK